MKKHYSITIKSKTDEPDYEDGIMAESKEDAIRLFQECLDTGLTDEELEDCVTEI